MLLMALTRGAAIGMHCHIDGLRSHQVLNIILEVTRLIFIPVLYQACFDLCELSVCHSFTSRGRPRGPASCLAHACF